MKINKIAFFLPLTVSFSLYGLYQAGAERQSIDWRLAFHQEQEKQKKLTQEFATFKKNCQYYLPIKSMNSFDDLKQYMLTADQREKNEILLLMTNRYNCPHNCPLITQFLLDNGAQINNKQGLFESTPLHEAARTGSTDLVQLLLDNGADVNAQDEDGGTPLHCAAWNGHIGIAQLLLTQRAHIADTTLCDNYGESAIDLARNCGHTAIVALLQAAEELAITNLGKRKRNE